MIFNEFHLKCAQKPIWLPTRSNATINFHKLYGTFNNFTDTLCSTYSRSVLNIYDLIRPGRVSVGVSIRTSKWTDPGSLPGRAPQKLAKSTNGDRGGEPL